MASSSNPLSSLMGQPPQIPQEKEQERRTKLRELHDRYKFAELYSKRKAAQFKPQNWKWERDLSPDELDPNDPNKDSYMDPKDRKKFTSGVGTITSGDAGIGKFTKPGVYSYKDAKHNIKWDGKAVSMEPFTPDSKDFKEGVKMMLDFAAGAQGAKGIKYKLLANPVDVMNSLDGPQQKAYYLKQCKKAARTLYREAAKKGLTVEFDSRLLGFLPSKDANRFSRIETKLKENQEKDRIYRDLAEDPRHGELSKKLEKEENKLQGTTDTERDKNLTDKMYVDGAGSPITDDEKKLEAIENEIKKYEGRLEQTDEATQELADKFATYDKFLKEPEKFGKIDDIKELRTKWEALTGGFRKRMLRKEDELKDPLAVVDEVQKRSSDTKAVERREKALKRIDGEIKDLDKRVKVLERELGKIKTNVSADPAKVGKVDAQIAKLNEFKQKLEERKAKLETVADRHNKNKQHCDKARDKIVQAQQRPTRRST